MVTKKKITDEKEKEKGRVQVGKLSLSRETIKDLSPEEKSRIKGGAADRTQPYAECAFVTIAICSVGGRR
jgi:hypothetical protein